MQEIYLWPSLEVCFTPEKFLEMYVENAHLGIEGYRGSVEGVFWYSLSHVPSPNMEPTLTLSITVPIKPQNLEKQGSKK